MRAVTVDYYTEVRSEKETEILETLCPAGPRPLPALLGRLKVTEVFTGYVKKRLQGGEAIAEYPLEAPPQIFETEGFWIAIPPGVAPEVASRGLHLMGGIHAFEHALIGIFPLTALSDRWDLGGISYPLHPQVGGPAVFVYDGYPGGVGLSRKGYERFESLLETTARVVRDCPCEMGCPGVHPVAQVRERQQAPGQGRRHASDGRPGGEAPGRSGPGGAARPAPPP